MATIGLFGFGCVGQGVYDIIAQSAPEFTIKKIAIKHPEKARSIDASYFTTDHSVLLNDPDIDIIVEAIDDAVVAFDIATVAARKGKKVITANKKMVAENFLALKALHEETKAPILYEASTLSSIPILKMLESYYGFDLIENIEGVFNSTTNYVLSKMHLGVGDYAKVLNDAKELGYAESDPSLDVNGADAKYKLCINIAHAFGLYIAPKDIFTYGIQTIEAVDVEFAKSSGQKIKLIAKAVSFNGDLSAWVMPTLVGDDSYIYNVETEDNCIKLCPSYADDQFYAGKGAGSFPTGSAVVSDIFAANMDYKYAYLKWHQGLQPEHLDDIVIPVYIRYKYEDQIENIAFKRIEQKSTFNNVKYVIGVIALSDLKKSELLNDPSIFVARLYEG